MNDVYEFQYRLLKMISERNLTAADLCRMTGIDKGAMSNYINGKYAPKQDKVYKLAEALDVDPGWLMTGDEPVSETGKGRPSYQYSDAQKVARAYEKAEEWQKEAVKKLLNIE